jgi:hypothetical protein
MSVKAMRDQLSVRGRIVQVPSVTVSGRRIIITGKLLRVASVKDEDLVDGHAVNNPSIFLESLRSHEPRADIFTFAESLLDTRPRHNYKTEWDNAAVIPLMGYKHWWEKRLPQETRRNVRRAVKLGVVVKEVDFDDTFVRGIMQIYNETPIRQGRAFWHYGKDFATVRRENATYLERSTFLGAFYQGELIGFLKLVYAGKLASIMQILSKNAHQDKRPSNALIAKAVEVCESQGMHHLVYCKYTYGRKTESHLTEFKKRNGFEQVIYPRYFIALTLRGTIALKLGLHHEWSAILPETLYAFAVSARKALLEFCQRRRLA